MVTGLHNNFGIEILNIRRTGVYVFLLIDIWPWNMDSPLSDDPNGEHYDLNALINDKVKIEDKNLFLIEKIFF
jgi:hypothetical protein